MDINATNLEAMKRVYTTALQEGLMEAADLNEVMPLATAYPSTTEANFYGFLSRIRGFREWIGERVVQQLESNTFIVKNKEYEDSARVRATEIEDDQYGVYAPTIRMMGNAWQMLKRQAIINALLANPKCWDGNAFFYDTHKYGDYTIDNYGTDALTQASYEAARVKMATYKFQDGTPCLSRPSLLVVPEKLRRTAYSIVGAPTVRDDVSSTTNTVVPVENPNYGMSKLLVLPEIDGYTGATSSWFLVDITKPVKPIALQIRKEAAPIMTTNPEIVLQQNFVDYLVTGRLAAAPAFFHLAYGSFVA